MNDEPLPPHTPNTPRTALEQRLAARPELLARFHQIVDLLDQSVSDDSDADTAEARVVEQVRQLGHDLLGRWAREANAHTQARVSDQHPHATRHGKKTPELADHLRLD